MKKPLVLIDEIHIRMCVLSTISNGDAKRICRTLKSKDFETKLMKAVCSVSSKFPELSVVRFHLSR